MPRTMKSELARACRHLLRPLVRALLRHGIAHDEFSEIAKSVYVEVAREDFGLPGKKTSDSRVAILTGLTRKEVAAVGERDGNMPIGENAQGNRATRVLSGWYQDPDFCGPDGQPIALPVDGRISFAALVKRYSGDMPHRAMLEELQRIGALSVDKSGNVRVRSRSYVPSEKDPEGARILGTAAHDLIATIEHNLARSGEEQSRFQRSAFNLHLSAKAVPILRRIVSERGLRFLESLDDWMSAHEAPATDEKDAVRAGIGVYFFEEKSDGDRK